MRVNHIAVIVTIGAFFQGFSGCTALPAAKSQVNAVREVPLCDRNAGKAVAELAELEQKIASLVCRNYDYECARQDFEKYYVLQDGTSEWPQVLPKVPNYQKTGAFDYAKYLAEREAFRDFLVQRAEYLQEQIQFLKYHLK